LSGRSKAWANEARQPSADAIPVYRGTETLIKYETNSCTDCLVPSGYNYIKATRT